MKKLIFIALLSFLCSGIHAQVKANSPSQIKYCNGDSYGFYIDEIPGAVAYTWSTMGATQAHIWDTGIETAVDLTFSRPGMCDVICTVTMDDGSEVVYAYVTDVYEEEYP